MSVFYLGSALLFSMCSFFPVYGTEAGEGRLREEESGAVRVDSFPGRSVESLPKYIRGKLLGKGSIAEVYCILSSFKDGRPDEEAQKKVVRVVCQRRILTNLFWEKVSFADLTVEKFEKDLEFSAQRARRISKGELSGILLQQEVANGNENILPVLDLFSLFTSSNPSVSEGFFTVHPRCFGGSLYTAVELLHQGKHKETLTINNKQEIEKKCSDVVRGYLAVVLDVLEYLHSRGVIHRDIKPGNILFLKPPLDDCSFPLAKDIRVCDFGFAAQMIAVVPPEKGGAHPGSYSYMSPAVFYGQAYDGRDADVYAAVCTFYVLLTGRHPFFYPTAKRLSIPASQLRQEEENYKRGDFEPEIDKDMAWKISPENLKFLRVALHAPVSPAKQPVISELRALFPWCSNQ